MAYVCTTAAQTAYSRIVISHAARMAVPTDVIPLRCSSLSVSMCDGKTKTRKLKTADVGPNKAGILVLVLGLGMKFHCQGLVKTYKFRKVSRNEMSEIIVTELIFCVYQLSNIWLLCPALHINSGSTRPTHCSAP